MLTARHDAAESLNDLRVRLDNRLENLHGDRADSREEWQEYFGAGVSYWGCWLRADLASLQRDPGAVLVAAAGSRP